ncbi:hypothetical protein DAPPUDRAFT_336986 [Daphnia pulex]|uniref:Uncharacterized protein n=1 Tax=Daphnia pulex TaxID=6669 RepID=E9I0R9_DAPPU|nr:hypothetical protein DAPPUDRAFT_336986 [Daphnia pulex]|eukprot:EFX62410.1 hypothetical protein DAPPUDRAFT_336986 [Daphnia pulex]
MANYGVALLSSVESLMAGSTTGVPMSSWYGGYQTATPPPYYPKATYATTSSCTEVFKYYTTKAPDLNSTTYAAPSHYTDALNCYTKAPADCYTEAAKNFSAPIYTTITEATKYYAVPTYCTEAALSYYVEQKYYTDAPVHYTTTYATPQPPINYGVLLLLGVVSLMAGSTAGAAMSPCCYIEAPADFSTKTVEYYTKAAKYFSAPIYTTTTEADKYYAVPTCYTKAALSCYVEQNYYTDAPVYDTTTYATPSYNTAAPKYYTEEAAYNNVHIYCNFYDYVTTAPTYTPKF